MTITTESSYVTYLGNGAATSWDYDFPIPSVDDVVIQILTIATGAVVTLTPAQYSISGVGTPDGGTVIYPLAGPALTSAKEIIIQRIVPLVQETDLSNQSAFYPETVEDALDYLTMIAQQIQAAIDNAAILSGALLRANNLADLLNAATARTNLGVSIGSAVQAWSTLLDQIAAISFARGDILYYNGTVLTHLAPGTSGQLLQTLGAGADPAWATVAGSGDVVGPSSAVDGQISLFNLTTGKLIKAATLTGLIKAASGVAAVAVAGTDYYAPGSTDVAVADGGTGASTAANARTNLGVVPGTDVQAFNARLADLAGITYAQGDVLYYNGSNIVKLAAGTGGQFLQTLGVGTNPQWSNPSGSGDVVGPASASDSQLALFNLTTGKLIKAAAFTGLVKLSSGVASAAAAGTDYYAPGGTDVAIADGGTGQSTAAAGFDALAPTTTRGDTIIRGASGNIRLALGAAGSLLTSDGTDVLWRAMATQANQEAASSIINPVTPGVQQFHPSAAKCWAYTTVSGGTPTLQTSYNITSITDSGVGLLTITINVDFSSANWASLFTVQASGVQTYVYESTHAAGSTTIQAVDNTGAVRDPAAYSFHGDGDQ